MPSQFSSTTVAKVLGKHHLVSYAHTNYTYGGTKAGEPSPPWKTKIVMACVRNILRVESQTVCSSPLRSSSPTLNPTNRTQPLNNSSILIVNSIKNDNLNFAIIENISYLSQFNVHFLTLILHFFCTYHIYLRLNEKKN